MTDLAAVDWRLYVIINATHPDPVALARAAIAGGAGVIQLRDKRGETAAMVELARDLVAVCREAAIPFIVNDRVDVALAVGADGVHVGPHDMSVADARRIAPGLWVGASAGTPDDARRAVAAGAHYLGSGAVYDARGSKPNAVHERGLAALAAVVAAVDVPVVGIGGITLDNAGRVAETGAAGIAVIRAVAEHPNPRSAARALVDAFTT